MKVSPVYSDGMILQRDAENHIGGEAQPGSRIRVRVGDVTCEERTDEKGRFVVTLPAFPAVRRVEFCLEELDREGKAVESIALGDVAFGDVFLLSGQSNMELSVNRTLDVTEREVRHADYPMIRQFAVPMEYDFHGPRQELSGGEWMYAQGQALMQFSAAGFFMARALYERYEVPIGLISSAVGGSPIQSWCSEGTIRDLKDYEEELLKCREDGYICAVQEKEAREQTQWHEAAQRFDGEPEGPAGEITVPGLWYHTELADFHGSLLLERDFQMHKGDSDTARVYLGAIVDADRVFINGHQVGGTEYRYPPRKYDFPAKYLNEGANHIRIEMLVFRNTGGFIPDKPYYVSCGGEVCALSGTWQYQIVRRMPVLEDLTFFQYKAAGLYNGMLSPLKGHAVKAIAFYQGESNTGRPEGYGAYFARAVEDWRALLHNPKLPVVYVQLAGFADSIRGYRRTGWAELREEQRRALAVEGTAMASAMDIGEYNDLHPQDKATLGKRLALCMEKLAYGEDVVYSGPLYEGMESDGDSLKLRFTHTGSGLAAKGTGGLLRGFEIAGADGIFCEADAWIEDNGVRVCGSPSGKPCQCRYAWSDNPEEANLYNKEGLPASCFIAGLEEEQSFPLLEEGQSAVFLVEKEADGGICRIAEKVVEDFNKVSGRAEKLHTVRAGYACGKQRAVLFAQCDRSPIVRELEREGKINLSGIRGKWEVYGSFFIRGLFGAGEPVMLIVGSDKRGTIYGMLQLSELMGVSPLCYWADAVIPVRDTVKVSVQDGFLSREPSVKYRGFFINDEWPCFGTWTNGQFGGFTAQMYDKVFELLLRLKGNYLWPAMWTSSFALDGPGTASAQLADLYGIVIGNSHHEPCLRASEEWDKVRGVDSIYGNAWSFTENREGLLAYWKDGLARSAVWESMATIGMRGERDSRILGEEATLRDNIALLKDVIHSQKSLVREAGACAGKELPMLLALYKEVEPFYYGTEDTPGLCGWEELEDVILMLCDDNHGYMRTLPDEAMRSHKAGFGMYYHLDYHGSPVSYEWVNSTPLTKIWEQMSMAYDYGVRKLWIVNVGDLKFNEFPLSYFMKLAYDFDACGTDAPDGEQAYTLRLLDMHFGGKATKQQVEEAEWILSETVRQNSYRRPEALNDTVYHPCYDREAERMYDRAKRLEDRTALLLSKLQGEVREAAYSLFGYAALASANLLQMHLCASLNHFYVKQGKKQANSYADKVRAHSLRDRELAREWAAFKDGKWKGMELAPHIGFTKWNEDGCRYPVIMEREPACRPRMAVSLVGEEAVLDKVYGTPMRLVVEDFLYEPETEAEIEICNTGTGQLTYQISMPDCSWLGCKRTQGIVEEFERILFTCDRKQLTETEEYAIVCISDSDTTVELCFRARGWKQELPPMTFLPGKNGYVMEPGHFFHKREPEGVVLRELSDYGVCGSGIKAYPDTADFAPGKEPALFYRLYARTAGRYVCEVWFTPVNPLNRSGCLSYGLCVNGEKPLYRNTVPAGYRVGEADDMVWNEGVLRHRRSCREVMFLREGTNEIGLLLPDAGLTVLRLFLYEEHSDTRASYLGPAESRHT